MPIAKKNIPSDFLEQMKTNTTKAADEDSVADQPASETEQNVEAVKSSSPVKTAEKKDKYADVMNIRLSKGRRNEIKAFCSSCGLTVTQYIESSFEFLEKEVQAGRVSITKGGINRIE